MKISRGQLIAAGLCLVPLGLMVLKYAANDLTSNPIQAATLRTGRTAITLLVLSLACTPIRIFFGLTSFLKIRKTLGLFAFLYAALHFTIFVVLDYQLNLAWIMDEIRIKPFIQIGLAALVLLIPLAITSINSFQKRLGKTWKALHRIVYLAVVLVVFHYLLAVKGDTIKPLIYMGITVFLLLMRLPVLSKFIIKKENKFITVINNFLLHQGLA